MSDLFDFLKNILPPENIFEIKINNMESRFEDLTKEQLIAELNISEQVVKTLRKRVDEYEQDEKKREFKRRLAEATDFLKANGYEVRQMDATERFPFEEEFQSLPGGVQVRKPERIWRDKDMIAFAYHFYISPSVLSPMIVLENFVQKYKP